MPTRSIPARPPRQRFSHFHLLLSGPVASWMLAVGMAGLAAPAVWAAPALVMEPASVDLGKVKAGQTGGLRLKLRNTGDRTLAIRGILGDCGCLTVVRYPRSLPAGSAAEVQLRFEPLPFWSGPMRKQLTIRTDDPAQPELKLPVRVEVVPYLKLEPRSPIVLEAVPGKIYHRELLLTPRAGSNLKLGKPSSDSPLVSAVLAPPAAGDRTRTQRLKLTIGPKQGPGDFTATVYVPTSERLASDWPIVIRGEAMTGPVVLPQAILLPVVRPDMAQEKLAQLRVFARSGRLKLLSVDTGTPLLKAEIVTTSPGRFYRVIIRAVKRLPPGMVETKLKIRTDDRTFPIVTVPLQATVR